MTEPIGIDDALDKFKRRFELADKIPDRNFTSEEVTNVLRQMFKLLAALQGECETLNAKIENLKAHRHVTGGMVFDAPKQPPSDNSSAVSGEPEGHSEEPSAES